MKNLLENKKHSFESFILKVKKPPLKSRVNKRLRHFQFNKNISQMLKSNLSSIQKFQKVVREKFDLGKASKSY